PGPKEPSPPRRYRPALRRERPRSPQVEARRDDGRHHLERLERPRAEKRRRTHDPWKTRAVHLFHYHLVTSQLREVEARYVGKLGFDLVARYGRIGDDHVTAEPGSSWEQLDSDGFRLRLTELQRGAVNVVIQPGHWRLPRIDHLGVVLDEDAFQRVLTRASQWNLPVQERGARRTVVPT